MTSCCDLFPFLAFCVVALGGSQESASPSPAFLAGVAVAARHRSSQGVAVATLFLAGSQRGLLHGELPAPRFCASSASHNLCVSCASQSACVAQSLHVVSQSVCVARSLHVCLCRTICLRRAQYLHVVSQYVCVAQALHVCVCMLFHNISRICLFKPEFRRTSDIPFIGNHVAWS